MKNLRYPALGPALVALGFLVTATPAGAAALEASWKEGIRLATDDGETKLKIGGRIMQDWTFQSGEDALLDAIGDLEDGTEFRRLRLYASGTVQRVMIFKTQLDFAGAEVVTKDAYVGVQKIPALGKITVGNQYEPMGLEETTSSKYITFIERSLTSTFTPSRNPGFLVTNSTDQVTWAAGVFRKAEDDGATSTGDGEYNYTGRLVLRPMNDDGGRKLVHLGVSGRIGNPPGGTVKFESRAENHLAPKYVKTGDIGDVADLAIFGVEGALVTGPFSLQGEFLQSMLSTEDNTDPSFSSFYVFGSYFLTGEHRAYKESGAIFDRVKPSDVFDGRGGRGAWEVAARFSSIDLNDGGISGGKLQDVTVGVNWYPNPNFRWMANYIRADLKDVGTSDAVTMRFQTDF